MKELFDQLTPVADHNGDPTYADEEIRVKASVVVNLEGNGLLAVLEDGIHVSFVVFAFASSTTGGEQRMWARVFHGSGPSSSLREPRHTYWGEAGNSGYIFYPSAKLICDAFHQLQRWFDCDG